MGLRDFFQRFLSQDHAAPVFESDGDVGRILDAIRDVQDPEVQVSIVEMGLVREVRVDDDGALIVMTLTTSGCPLVNVIRDQVADAVRAVGFEPTVEMTFSPPWSPEDMSEVGRAALARR